MTATSVVLSRCLICWLATLQAGAYEQLCTASADNACDVKQAVTSNAQEELEGIEMLQMASAKSPSVQGQGDAGETYTVTVVWSNKGAGFCWLFKQMTSMYDRTNPEEYQHFNCSIKELRQVRVSSVLSPNVPPAWSAEVRAASRDPERQLERFLDENKKEKAEAGKKTAAQAKSHAAGAHLQDLPKVDKKASEEDDKEARLTKKTSKKDLKSHAKTLENTSKDREVQQRREEAELKEKEQRKQAELKEKEERKQAELKEKEERKRHQEMRELKKEIAKAHAAAQEKAEREKLAAAAAEKAMQERLSKQTEAENERLVKERTVAQEEKQRREKELQQEEKRRQKKEKEEKRHQEEKESKRQGKEKRSSKDKEDEKEEEKKEKKKEEKKAEKDKEEDLEEDREDEEEDKNEDEEEQEEAEGGAGEGEEKQEGREGPGERGEKRRRMFEDEYDDVQELEDNTNKVEEKYKKQMEKEANMYRRYQREISEREEEEEQEQEQRHHGKTHGHKTEAKKHHHKSQHKEESEQAEQLIPPEETAPKSFAKHHKRHGQRKERTTSSIRKVYEKHSQLKEQVPEVASSEKTSKRKHKKPMASTESSRKQAGHSVEHQETTKLGKATDGHSSAGHEDEHKGSSKEQKKASASIGEGTGQTASLDEEGYQAVLALHDVKEMARFIRRSAQELLNLEVHDQARLAEVAQMYDSDREDATFINMLLELEYASRYEGENKWVTPKEETEAIEALGFE